MKKKNTAMNLRTAVDPKCAILCGHSPKEMHE